MGLWGREGNGGDGDQLLGMEVAQAWMRTRIGQLGGAVPRWLEGHQSQGKERQEGGTCSFLCQWQGLSIQGGQTTGRCKRGVQVSVGVAGLPER